MKGFGVQVEPTGTKTYIVRYRPKGLGRSAPRRFLKIGRHGSLTTDEARAQAMVVLGEVAAGQNPAATARNKRNTYESRRNALTLGQVGRLFLSEHAQTLRKTSTAANYEIQFRLHIEPALGATLAEDVTRDDVTRLHRSMNANPTNANRTLALVSSIYTFASKRGLVPEGSNPARGVQKYREQACMRYLTSEELQRLGAALIEAETVGIPWTIDETNPKSKHTPKSWKGQREVIDPSAVSAIRLLLFTGARVREILDLRWETVDIERGLLFLADSKTGTKTIVLNTSALEVLQQLKCRHQAIGNGPQTGFVIKGLIENQPRADLNRPWRAIRRRAGLNDLRLHDLRHTFASIGTGASLGLPVVGRLLGHSQPQTTARYAHLDNDPLRRAADLIGSHIASALEGKNEPGPKAGKPD